MFSYKTKKSSSLLNLLKKRKSLGDNCNVIFYGISRDTPNLTDGFNFWNFWNFCTLRIVHRWKTYLGFLCLGVKFFFLWEDWTSLQCLNQRGVDRRMNNREKNYRKLGCWGDQKSPRLIFPFEGIGWTVSPYCHSFYLKIQRSRLGKGESFFSMPCCVRERSEANRTVNFFPTDQQRRKINSN